MNSLYEGQQLGKYDPHVVIMIAYGLKGPAGFAVMM